MITGKLFKDIVDMVDQFPENYKSLSPDARRTVRQKYMIARGYHPFGAELLKPEGKTCRQCKFAYAKSQSNTYWKCEKSKDTAGPATDLRLKWPACVLFQEKESFNAEIERGVG